MLAGCVGLCDLASAQSFDCKLAKTAVEKAVCSSKALGAADDAMAATYKQVLGEVPVDVQAEVKAGQRAWLRGLAARCKANAAQMSLTDCLLAEYKGQIKELHERVVTKGGVTFVTRSIEVLSKDDADDPWLKSPDLEQNPGYGTLEASWPQALSDAPEWKIWNAAVLAETQKMAGNGDPNPTHIWQKTWAAGTDATVTATMGDVGPELVSVSIANGMMGHGAAHPNEASETFHWLLKEKRVLKVSDVFVPGSAWEKVASARCRAALKAQVGEDYQSYAGSTAADFAKTLHGVVAEPKNWDIDAKGITINFPEYSVTPRAEPVDGVLVSWSALKEYLAKDFVVPK
jgi:uncharacterized protein YecT (DUF1311 family)